MCDMSTEHLVSNNERRKSCTTGGLEVLKGQFSARTSRRAPQFRRGSGPAGTRLKKNQSSVLGNINIRNFGYESFQASTAHEGVCLRFFSKKKDGKLKGAGITSFVTLLDLWHSRLIQNNESLAFIAKRPKLRLRSCSRGGAQ